MTEQIVFQGDHLQATLVHLTTPNGVLSDRLMVTFDFRKVGKSDFAPPITSSNFARAGFSQLSIRTRFNDWFINAETYALEAALPGIVAGFAEVRTLGYSMGGYGAFRFSEALGAKSVTAVSPQVSLDPALVPFDKRYATEAAGFDPAIGNLDQVARDDLRGMILLDPFIAADLRHAQMLQRLFPAVGLARMGFGGHPATRLLREAGKSWAIAKLAGLDAPNRGQILHHHRAARRQSTLYWTRLATKAVRRRPVLAATAQDIAAGLAAGLAAKGGQ